MKKIIILTIMFAFVASLAMAEPLTKEQIEQQYTQVKTQYDNMRAEFTGKVNALKAKLYDLNNEYNPKLNELVKQIQDLASKYAALSKEQPKEENAD